jgi:hypothetical protein
MAGFGRYKLTDALPPQPAPDQSELTGSGRAGSLPGTGRSKGKLRNKPGGGKGKPPIGTGLAAEQVREARQSNQAKNAEASARDRMVDIGRGNQQAGRQRAK